MEYNMMYYKSQVLEHADNVLTFKSGKVGIGTDNPLDPLNVQSTGASDFAFRIFRSTSATQGFSWIL